MFQLFRTLLFGRMTIRCFEAVLFRVGIRSRLSIHYSCFVQLGHLAFATPRGLPGPFLGLDIWEFPKPGALIQAPPSGRDGRALITGTPSKRTSNF